jgi:four helix bundle protein
MGAIKKLPHERLVAFEVATEMLRAVVAAKIADPALKDQAIRAAKSVCLNIAEAAGRRSSPDRARVFSIARGEACEAAAAIHVATITGECQPGASEMVAALASRAGGSSDRTRARPQSPTLTRPRTLTRPPHPARRPAPAPGPHPRRGSAEARN